MKTSDFSEPGAQRGGTLIGFVVGVVLGLGAALAVAIYVTKVPVPFVDRGVSRSQAQDQKEAEHNKGWNPNASLMGKQTDLPPLAVPAEGAIAAAPADGKALPIPGEVGAPNAANGSGKDPAAYDDPLGDLMRLRLGDGGKANNNDTTTAAVSPAGEALPDGFSYFVQAGAFRNPDDAQAQRAKLALIGMAAEVTEREQSGRTVFRVRLGPFSDRGMAEATRGQLEVNSVEAALVRVQR